MFGISIARREIPDELIERHRLKPRVSRRSAEAEEEVVFMEEARPALLPVWHHGQIEILSWCTWKRAEHIEAGEWGGEKAEIPVTFCYDNGVWFAASRIQCSVLGKTVYLISQPSTHYYQVMTGQARMPVFVGRGI